MRRSVLALGPGVVAIVIAGCGGASHTSSAGTSTPTSGKAQPAAPNRASTVDVATNARLGKILVDSQGRTLYLFVKDTGASSTCYGACAAAWPVLATNAEPIAGAGVSAAKLGTTRRSDGATQVTYNGHPLYYYVSDTAPGQTTGQAISQFGGEWDALSPAGDKSNAAATESNVRRRRASTEARRRRPTPQNDSSTLQPTAR